MMKTFDRAFCGLLAFAAVGHLYGTFALTDFGSGLFVWSLSGVLAAMLLAALNFLRSTRTTDRALASITFVGSIAWIGIAVLFGLSIQNVADPRVLVHILAAAGTAFFSFKALRIQSVMP